MKPCIAILLLGAAPTVAGAKNRPHVAPAEAQAAVEKYIPVLERSLLKWADSKTPCVSCHHHLLGAMVLSMARERGLKASESVLRAAGQPIRQGPDLTELTLQGLGPVTINPGFNGYVVLGVQAMLGGGTRPDPSLMAAVARRQRADGRWASLFHRPPSEDSDFSTTALSIRTLQLVQTPGRSAEARQRIDRAREWLVRTPAVSTEDRAFQLLGLSWAGVRPPNLAQAAKHLIHEQRPDGGWAQLTTRSSDAYATGLALFALSQGAGLPPRHPAIEKGLKYLIVTQKADGTWLVPTRHHPPMQGNPFYVDTFPHGPDQFISCAGSNWAAMALLSLLPKVKAPEALPPAASNLPPWADTVLFAGTEELRKLLDGGLDPNAKAPGGTSVLMMSVYSPEKVRLLIERGADVNAKAVSGATALIAAAGLNGNSESVRLLVDAGADVNHSAAGATPLGLAVTTDDTEKIATLIARGADPNGRFVHAGLGAFYPLQIAVGAGNADIVRLLIAKGARIDGHMNVWRGALPPLATAVEGGQIEMVKLLISLGADVNQRDPLGMTPLLWAAISDYGATDTVNLLLNAGADASARDKSGADARALATKYELHHIARALARVQVKESR